MQLNYKITGSGHPTIFLHGLFGMLDNWRTIARALESQYQCILIDLRNHGRSPRSDDMSYNVMAEDVLVLMNDLQLESATILGHSMGGKVAMQFALQFPERISRLIVVDISPRAYPPHHDDVIDAIESIDPSSLENRSDAEGKFRSFLKGDDETIQFLFKNLNRLPAGGFEWKANMPILIKEYDHLISGIDSRTTYVKPALFVRGALSRSIRDEDWVEILKKFPEAQLVTISNAGHWVHADQPGALIDTLLSFMAS